MASTDGLPQGCRSNPTSQAVELRDLALDRIRQGVCVFDGEQRLLLFNRQYAEIYRMDASQLLLGMTLREVVDRRYAAGTGPDMLPAEYSAWRDRIGVADRVTDTEVVLQDGRCLAIHHAPTPDGGWVSTHEDITERRRAEAHVRHMAHHDALTALPNRSFFIQHLHNTLAWLRGDGLDDHRPAPAVNLLMAVLFIDLDRFKDVNDTFGHAAGDELLRLVALRIRNCINRSDVLARLGGDEFAILAGPMSNAGQAAAVALRVIEAASAPYDLDGTAARVGASVGIALCRHENPDVQPSALLQQADMALYRAKAAGRNTFRVFDGAGPRLAKRGRRRNPASPPSRTPAAPPGRLP